MVMKLVKLIHCFVSANATIRGYGKQVLEVDDISKLSKSSE